MTAPRAASVLVLGSGAREHALLWKLRQSERVATLYCAPGNTGTATLATNLPVSATDVPGVVMAVQQHGIDFVLVGPEAPLAVGVVDALQQAGVRVFGPRQGAAQIEASKVWAKQLLLRHGIPTGGAEVVSDEPAARAAVARYGYPAVFKADGLAAGKGVIVASTPEDVDGACEKLFRERAFGAASDQVLMEEHLAGREISIMAFVDGQRVAIIPPARDYKRIFDGDQGPNTGGMGGYSRPSDVTPDLVEQIRASIVQPTVDALAAEGREFRGLLYGGIMLTETGPREFEFNARFGDPECELVMPLLEGDLLDVLEACVDGRLQPEQVRWSDAATCCVVLAAEGYPDAPLTGAVIHGLDSAPEDVLVFHAGTARSDDGAVVTAGGRVLALVARADTLAEAQARLAAAIGPDGIHFDGMQLRRDILRADAGAAEQDKDDEVLVR